MAAALFRRGTGLCVRCLHRELCRLVWKPQTALFSSKPSDRKQPRRTHIKKAKPQPAVDVVKLLEQLFSQRRPGTVPPAGKARPAKASSMPTKPPTTSSEPAVSVFPAASTFKQADCVPKKTASTFESLQPSVSPANPKTSSERPQQSELIQVFAADSVSNVTVPPTSTTPASLESEAAAIEWQTSAETIETKVGSAPELPSSAHMLENNVETSSFSAATVEPLIETTTESPVEPSLSPVGTVEVRAAVVEGPVEPSRVQTQGTDAGVADVSHTAKDEPLIETTVDSEASHFLVETLETKAAVVEGPVEPTIDVTVDLAAETESTNSGVVNISHTATVEPLLETTVEPSVETRAAEGSVETSMETQAIQTNSTDSGAINVSYSAREEPSIETTIEPEIEAVSEGTIELTIETEAADDLSHTALIQNTQESAPLSLKNKVESTAESTVESSSGNVAVEEGANKSEQMTLESVTLHAVQVLVESLKADELLQTKSILDERAEKQLPELLVQTGTGAEHKAAETENSSEDESDILTKVLSKWDSLSEDLHELEGESGMLVKELLCHVPAVLYKTPDTVKTCPASDPPAGANGDSWQMEQTGTSAEAVARESISLAKVMADAGGVETEVLLETRNAVEKEAEVLAKEEKMEVKTATEDVAVFEDTKEADILTQDSVSEATDATSIILEAMFSSRHELREPTDTLLVGQEAEKESREQEGRILEAMNFESVSLAEVEASLGTLENESLSETTDYLEKRAEILAGEKRTEVEEGVASEESTEVLKMEFLSLPEGDDLVTDLLMEELLFSVPWHVTGVTEGQIGQEVVRANILNASVATGSVDGDAAAAATDDCPASATLKEVLLGQEAEQEGAQTEASENKDGTGTHTDLDPVQKLFLEKIREYNNMRRLSGGLLEAEPDCEKYLSEETAKLQRLYGGGDLSSFPQFTFTEPKMDP